RSVTIAVTVIAPKVTKRLPAAILGLVAGISTYFALGVFVPGLWTLSGNTLVIGSIDTSGSLIQVITGSVTSLSQITISDIGLVAASAATLSVLLSIDTLKTGVVLDALTRRRHNSNRELVAQGCANAASALCGGMPGAGTMGPTLVNVSSGGQTKWSGFMEGALALVVFLVLRPLIAWVPIGALAGILLVISFKMFDWHAFRLLMKPTTRLDFVIIATVVVVAKGVGLIQASLVGIGLSALIFIRNQVRGSVILRKRDLREVASKTFRSQSTREVLDLHGDEGLLVELRDDLFFGTTDQLYTELNDDLLTRRFILFDLRRVQSMDYTAGNLFNQMNQRLKEREGGLLLSGLPSGLSSRQDIEHYLVQLGLTDNQGGIHICETRNDALEYMEKAILKAADWTDDENPEPLELGEVDLFREFNDDELGAIDEIVEEVHLEAGESLFAQGDEGDALYVVRRGSVEIFLPLPEKKRHHLATMTRGNYFGEMSFLDNDRRSADGVARADTDLFKLSRHAFNTLALKEAAIGIRVFARLALMVSRRMRTADAEIRTLEER
ncbi:cyclic nucleotide-binding domain-containing protein, partial [Myxococcota bacterium]|nr:cyclic nucleotide-binding domain-containing protein [Myxococcota bacterium]